MSHYRKQVACIQSTLACLERETGTDIDPEVYEQIMERLAHAENELDDILHEVRTNILS